VLRTRTPLYEAAAHHRIDTDARSPEQVAAEVAALYARHDASHD
jgi:shikimate kinase